MVVRWERIQDEPLPACEAFAKVITAKRSVLRQIANPHNFAPPELRRLPPRISHLPLLRYRAQTATRASPPKTLKRRLMWRRVTKSSQVT
jgi:hypothetical protein